MTKLPVRGSADRESHHYLPPVDVPVIWTVNGLRYQFPVMSYDTSVGWISYWNPFSNTKHTLVGLVRVMTIDEWNEANEKRNGR